MDQISFIKFLEKESNFKIKYDKNIKPVFCLSFQIFLEEIIIKQTVLQIFLGLLTNYLYDLWKKPNNKEMKVRFDLKIVKTKNKVEKEINFQGDKKEFEKLVEEIKNIK